MSLTDAVRAAHILAAILAVAVAWRRRDCVALASFIAGTALADAARGALRLTSPWLSGDIPPLHTAIERVVLHVDQALYLTWSAGLAAVALATLAPGRAEPVQRTSDPEPLPPRRSVTWLPLAGWAVIVATLSAFYIRTPNVRSVYLFADVLAVAVAVGALGIAARDRLAPTLSRVAVIAVLSAHAAALFVVWSGDGWARWQIALGSYLGLYTLLCLILGGALWAKPASSSSR